MCHGVQRLQFIAKFALPSKMCSQHIHSFHDLQRLALQNAGGRVYMELRSGKAYLSSMPADSSHVREFVLLDVRGLHNKAGAV